MPRKEFEGQPLHEKGKMTEEAREAIFKEEEQRADDELEEGVDRQYSGASESGSGKQLQKGDQTARHAKGGG